MDSKFQSKDLILEKLAHKAREVVVPCVANAHLCKNVSPKEMLEDNEIYLKNFLETTKYDKESKLFEYRLQEFQSKINLERQTAIEFTQTNWYKKFLSKYSQIVKWEEKLNRDANCVIYYIPSVIFVIIWARLCCENFDNNAIVKFWRENHHIIRILIPHIPSANHMISHETVRTIRTAIDENELENFFNHFTKKATLKLQGIIAERNAEQKGTNFLPTICMDGQEIRASYQDGEYSRKKKGANITSLFNTQTNQALDYKTVTKKNNETKATISMLSKLAARGSCIFMADSLNTTEPMLIHLNEYTNIDWLMPIKDNAGNKKLNNLLAKTFSEKPEIFEYTSRTDKVVAHGREEERSFYMISVSKLYDHLSADDQKILEKETEKEKFKNLKSFVIYGKSSRRFLVSNPKAAPDPSKTDRVYICSLESNVQNFMQVMDSIKHYWAIEVQHNTLDVVMLQDYNHVKNKNHIDSIVAINKIGYSFASYLREMKFIKNNLKRKPSFRDIFDELKKDRLKTFEELMLFALGED